MWPMSSTHLTHALAIECSTDRLSLALAVGPLPLPGAATWDGVTCLRFEGEGSAKASTSLVPEALRLLAEAGLRVQDLGVIAYGQGPGAFTGLRTACAATQGLALGGGDRPVLGVDTLMNVAQAARMAGASGRTVTALMDARMNEIYAASYLFDGGLVPASVPEVLAAPALLAPDQVVAHAMRWATHATERQAQIAGNALGIYGDAITGWPQPPRVENIGPNALAMLYLIPALWAAGRATVADEAMPVYVRERVALTTAERAAQKASAEPTD